MTEASPKDHLSKIISKLEFYMIYQYFTYEKLTPLLAAMFLMGQINLNNLGRGSPKDDLYKIISKLAPANLENQVNITKI